MSDKKRVPKLRFPGFTEPWEQRKLEDIYGSIGNAFVGTATPYYVESGHFYLESNNIKDGQINHNTEVFINDEFYEKQKDKWLHTGDMVMVQSGHVGHAAVIPEELNNSAAHALIMFRNPKKEIEPYFLNYQYQTLKSKKKIENITTGNTIKHILASEMQQFEVDMPELAEQKKIAEYFSGLDHLITLHQRKLEHVKKMKKSMLQKMFPKKNQLYPEVRFPGFTDAWEQRKFSDVGSVAMCKRIFKEQTSDEGEVPFYKIGTFGGIPDAFISRKLFDEYKTKYPYPNKGDILISASGSIGRTVEFTGKDEYFQDSNIVWLKHGDEIDNSFLKVLYSVVEWSCEGSTIKRLYNDNFLKTNFMLPKIDEQIKLGAYFSSLDHLITLHQRELDHLQLLKKGMLQQMFI